MYLYLGDWNSYLGLGNLDKSGSLQIYGTVFHLLQRFSVDFNSSWCFDRDCGLIWVLLHIQRKCCVIISGNQPFLSQSIDERSKHLRYIYIYDWNFSIQLTPPR